MSSDFNSLMNEVAEKKKLDSLMGHFIGKPFRQPTHDWYCTCQYCGGDNNFCYGECHYSDELEYALPVWMELNKRGWLVDVQTAPNETTGWVIIEPDDGHSDKHTFRASTPAQAICLAAKYVMEEDG